MLAHGTVAPEVLAAAQSLVETLKSPAHAVAEMQKLPALRLNFGVQGPRAERLSKSDHRLTNGAGSMTNHSAGSLEAQIQQLLAEWRQIVAEEDNDDFGRERASVRSDDIDALAALLPGGRPQPLDELIASANAVLNELNRDGSWPCGICGETSGHLLTSVCGRLAHRITMQLEARGIAPPAPEDYPWDKVRSECWGQVQTIFREEGPLGEMQQYFRAAAVTNARRLDEEQIRVLRDEVHRLQQTLAATRGSVPAPAWHPISSAPKDGTRVLTAMAAP